MRLLASGWGQEAIGFSPLRWAAGLGVSMRLHQQQELDMCYKYKAGGAGHTARPTRKHGSAGNEELEVCGCAYVADKGGAFGSVL